MISDNKCVTEFNELIHSFCIDYTNRSFKRKSYQTKNQELKTVYMLQNY